jgi:hypothetical protein
MFVHLFIQAFFITSQTKTQGSRWRAIQAKKSPCCPVNLSNIQLNLKKIATEIILTFLSTVTPLETNMKNRL